MVKKSKQTNKTKKRKMSGDIKFLISIIIICTVFLGSVYYSNLKASKEAVKDDYNEFNFQYDYTNNLWFTQIQIGSQPYYIPFYYHPSELEDIIVEDGVEDIILRNKPQNIIIAIPNTSGSQIAIAGIEITKITGERYNVLNIPTSSAFNQPLDNYPYVTCDNASEKTVIISMIEGENNLISSNDRCITLEFKHNESIRVADAFAYNLIKIM